MLLVIRKAFSVHWLCLRNGFQTHPQICTQSSRILFWISVKESESSFYQLPALFIFKFFIFVGVEQCSTTEWDTLWTLYKNEHDPQEKAKFMKALCKTKRSDLIERYYISIRKMKKYFNQWPVYVFLTGIWNSEKMNRWYDLKIIYLWSSWPPRIQLWIH